MIDRLIDLLLQLGGALMPFAVLDEFERGVVLRFGKFQREAGPGLHWIIPFGVDHVLVDNVVTRTKTLSAQALTTSDARTISVTAVVTASIRNIRKALLEVENMDHALVDACAACIGQHVASHTWDELRTEANAGALSKACRAQAWRYGIEIERVQLADLAPCRVIRLHGEMK